MLGCHQNILPLRVPISPNFGPLMRMMWAAKSPWSDQPLEQTSGTRGTHIRFSKHVWIPLDDLCMKLFI